MLAITRPEDLQAQKFLSSVKIYKPRANRTKETQPRKQPEAELRVAVINLLRRRGYRVMRLENSICGKHNIGMPDLLLFKMNGFVAVKMIWVELKSINGTLRKEQMEFRDNCLSSGVEYLIIRSIEECSCLLMKT